MPTPHFHVETCFGGKQETIGIYDTLEGAVECMITGVEVNVEDDACQWSSVVASVQSYTYYYGCSEPIEDCHDEDACALCQAPRSHTVERRCAVPDCTELAEPGTTRCRLHTREARGLGKETE